jgi:hypothetical protein
MFKYTSKKFGTTQAYALSRSGNITSLAETWNLRNFTLYKY